MCSWILAYPDGAEIAVDRLAQLYDEMEHDTEIAEFYANGLILLSLNQNLLEHNEAVGALEKLHQNHSDWEDMAANFMGVLVNLSFYQNSESEVRCTLARSSEIFGRYPQNRDIQLKHAQTWFNLTFQQQEADISATVTDIVDFLCSNTNAIPKFKEALDDYLYTHPDHKVRYQPLLLL